MEGMQRPGGASGAFDGAARRWRRLPVTAQDAVLAGLLEAALLVAWPYGPDPVPRWAVGLSQLAVCLPLVWRRRYPFPSALAVGAVAFLHQAVLDTGDPFTVWVAAFAAWSAVRHGARVSLVAPLSAVWILLLFNALTRGEMIGRETVAQQVVVVVLGTLPAFFGYLLRLRAERAQQWRRELRSRAQRDHPASCRFASRGSCRLRGGAWITRWSTAPTPSRCTAMRSRPGIGCWSSTMCSRPAGLHVRRASWCASMAPRWPASAF